MTGGSRLGVVALAGAVAGWALSGCGGSTAGAPHPGAAAQAASTMASTVPPSTVPPSTIPPAGPPTAIVDPGWVGQAGDGAWQAAGRSVGGVPAMFTTVLHHAGATYAVAWMDQHRLQLVLYAGTTQPPGAWSHDGSVAPADAARLVAAFNSGFKLVDSRGGWYADGRVGAPLAVGAASLVVRADGTATIGIWGVDVGLAPDVVAVRQNLQLLVDGGEPTPAVASPDPIRVWGDPLHEKVVTWRSALALDRTGQLLYVAATAASPGDLADAVVAAGGVRAMELDINPQWVAFDAFSGQGTQFGAVKLVPTMAFPATHFLQPYFRDFFAVFAR